LEWLFCPEVDTLSGGADAFVARTGGVGEPDHVPCELPLRARWRSAVGAYDVAGADWGPMVPTARAAIRAT